MQQRQKTNSNTFRALFLKNLTLQSKQKCTNCCQIFTPIISIIFTIIIQQIAGSEMILVSNTVAVPLMMNVPNYLTSKYVYNITRNPLCLKYYQLQVNQTSKSFVGQNWGNGTKSGMLGNVLQQSKCSFHPDPNNTKQIFQLQTPFFNLTDNGNMNIYDSIKTLNTQALKNKSIDIIPDGGLNIYSADNNTIKASIQTNDQRFLSYHRTNGLSKIYAKFNVTDIFDNNDKIFVSIFTSTQAHLILMDLLSKSYAKQVSNIWIMGGILDMPSNGQGGGVINKIINLLSSTLFALSLSLLLPVFMYSLVLQKQQKLVQMMKMNGLTMSSYWINVVLFNFIVSVIAFGIFYLFGYFLLANDFFKQTPTLIILILLLGWALSQISIAIFFQTFIQTARTANIIGYLLSIWTNIICTTLNLGVYPYPLSIPKYLVLYPPVGFSRALYILLSSCSNGDCIHRWGDLNQQWVISVIFLYIGAIIFFILGIYLYEIWPRDFGVRKNWNFCFDFFRTKVKQIQVNDPMRDQFINQKDQDQTVKNEKIEIENIQNQGQYPLIVKQLRKIYGGNHVALKSFSLLVKQGQIFGLLGPNGAGKTTFLSLITGLSEPNYGNAWICGFNIKQNISKVHLNIGVCPQFDLLWPQLTVQQHLLFYARLKGIPKNQQLQVATKSMQQVLLTQSKDKMANQLSGGMKRRLSVAICLAGKPKIAFLDQPTTGLDPQNRRQLWNIISKCKKSRSILLTTHSMQQADILCTRIGIITDGILRCVGPQVQLKKQYAGGYYLEITLFKRSKLGKQLVKFIFNSFQGVKLKKEFSNNFKFEMSIEKIKLSYIFQTLQKYKKNYDIENWALSQPRLEEVFMNVVTKHGYLNEDE